MDIHPVVLRALQWKTGEVKFSKEEERELALSFQALIMKPTVMGSDLIEDGLVESVDPTRPRYYGVSKSAFVRSLPSSMPGAEVVAKAKAEGLDIGLAYVYGIRSKAKARVKTTSKTKNRNAHAPAVVRTTKVQPKLLLDAVLKVIGDSRMTPQFVYQRFQERGWKGAEISIRKAMGRGVKQKRLARVGKGLYAAR